MILGYTFQALALCSLFLTLMSGFTNDWPRWPRPIRCCVEKDSVCTWSRDTTNRILVFCTYLYVVAEQTLSISVVGTAQLTTGIIKHTIGFVINDPEHLLSIPFKSCYHKLLYLINTAHNSPLDHKSHNGLLLINDLNLCAPTVIRAHCWFCYWGNPFDVSDHWLLAVISHRDSLTHLPHHLLLPNGQ